MKEHLGVALVGLGEYATGQLMPALEETVDCRLTGIVSGSEEKRVRYSQVYNIPKENVYSYDNFDAIATNEDIDIVYIALPNSMHAEFSIRAARAGKHIICEKPMALNVTQSREIIQAVRQYDVRFSMGYRLHFDPFNREMQRLGQQKIFGEVKKMVLHNSMKIGDANQWRLDKHLAGGGPLMNNGVYCVQAAIYLTGLLPTSVKASYAPITDPEKFKQVEEGISWTFSFDNGAVAECETNYSKDQNLMRVEAQRGWFELSPAYEYSGLKGVTSNGPMSFPPTNQQALQMDNFCRCILTGHPTIVPPEMGLRDMEIMAAIYEAAESGRQIDLQLSYLNNMADAQEYLQV